MQTLWWPKLLAIFSNKILFQPFSTIFNPIHGYGLGELCSLRQKLEPFQRCRSSPLSSLPWEENQKIADFSFLSERICHSLLETLHFWQIFPLFNIVHSHIACNFSQTLYIKRLNFNLEISWLWKQARFCNNLFLDQTQQGVRQNRIDSE